MRSCERACESVGCTGGGATTCFRARMRAKPYSVRGLVGPAGERWAPVHGIFALSRARAAMADLAGLRRRGLAAQMQDLGVTASWLISVLRTLCADRADALLARSARSASYAVSFPAQPRAFRSFREKPRRAANSLRTMRERLRDIMDQHGAVHSQIGRFYR